MHLTCALLASMYLFSCMTYTPHSQEGATTLRHKEYQNINLPLSTNKATLKSQRVNNPINSCNKIHTHHMQQATHKMNMQQDTHKMNMQTYGFNLQITPACNCFG